MGRQTRQQRRLQARREQRKPQAKKINWTLIIGAAVVIAALGLFAHAVFGSSSAGAGKSSLLADNPTIDGIKCGPTEQTSYHQHAHLTLYDAGKQVTVPQQIGISQACLYWVHTHDASGLIHMEAPVGVVPSLKTVFDIWREPSQTISRTQFFSYKVKPGQSLKVWLNQRPYAGNPAAIRLHRHTDMTIEIGPPFVVPKKYQFGSQ